MEQPPARVPAGVAFNDRKPGLAREAAVSNAPKPDPALVAVGSNALKPDPVPVVAESNAPKPDPALVVAEFNVPKPGRVPVAVGCSDPMCVPMVAAATIAPATGTHAPVLAVPARSGPTPGPAT